MPLILAVPTCQKSPSHQLIAGLHWTQPIPTREPDHRKSDESRSLSPQTPRQKTGTAVKSYLVAQLRTKSTITVEAVIRSEVARVQFRFKEIVKLRAVVQKGGSLNTKLKSAKYAKKNVTGRLLKSRHTSIICNNSMSRVISGSSTKTSKINCSSIYSTSTAFPKSMTRLSGLTLPDFEAYQSANDCKRQQLGSFRETQRVWKGVV